MEIMGDDCYRYGSGHGCDYNCPVLQEGNCKAIIEIIDSGDFDFFELNNIINTAYPPDIIQYFRNKKLNQIYD